MKTLTLVLAALALCGCATTDAPDELAEKKRPADKYTGDVRDEGWNNWDRPDPFTRHDNDPL